MRASCKADEFEWPRKAVSERISLIERKAVETHNDPHERKNECKRENENYQDEEMAKRCVALEKKNRKKKG